MSCKWCQTRPKAIHPPKTRPNHTARTERVCLSIRLWSGFLFHEIPRCIFEFDWWFKRLWRFPSDFWTNFLLLNSWKTRENWTISRRLLEFSGLVHVGDFLEFPSCFCRFTVRRVWPDCFGWNSFLPAHESALSSRPWQFPTRWCDCRHRSSVHLLPLHSWKSPLKHAKPITGCSSRQRTLNWLIFGVLKLCDCVFEEEVAQQSKNWEKLKRAEPFTPKKRFFWQKTSDFTTGKHIYASQICMLKFPGANWATTVTTDQFANAFWSPRYIFRTLGEGMQEEEELRVNVTET